MEMQMNIIDFLTGLGLFEKQINLLKGQIETFMKDNGKKRSFSVSSAPNVERSIRR